MLNNINNFKTDLLIIGNGIAGIRAANVASQKGINVTVVSKGGSASPEVMGFNAPLGKEDSVEIYYEDILSSGEQINNKSLARVLAGDAEKEVKNVERLGVELDKDPDGSYNAMRALGCKFPRLVHYKALTGSRAMKAMTEECKENNVLFHKNIMIIDLIKHGGRVVGAFGVNMMTGELVSYQSKAVILATGGCGNIHPISTYPKGLVGDGYAMAFRAGADLVDMEFHQYEPCCFVHPKKLQGNLIVTTLLAEGGKLLNYQGEEFLLKKGEPGYTLQKAGLSRRIIKEIEDGNGTEHGGIYYDVTAVPRDRVVVDHCIFYEPAYEAGVDITKEAAEVSPAAHTFLGGVKINDQCKTSVEGLFAAGEVTGGVHGANRLGGSAGGEVFIFGARAGQYAADYVLEQEDTKEDDIVVAFTQGVEEFSKEKTGNHSVEELDSIIEKIGFISEEFIGIIRNEMGLKNGWYELLQIEELLEDIKVIDLKSKTQLVQCKNMILICKLQIQASLLRKESRGVYYRSDYPTKNDELWKKNIILRNNEENIETIISECE